MKNAFTVEIRRPDLPMAIRRVVVFQRTNVGAYFAAMAQCHGSEYPVMPPR
jgi:hypothetical protein